MPGSWSLFPVHVAAGFIHDECCSGVNESGEIVLCFSQLKATCLKRSSLPVPVQYGQGLGVSSDKGYACSFFGHDPVMLQERAVLQFPGRPDGSRRESSPDRSGTAPLR